MTKRFAFERFADEDLFLFLNERLGRPFRPEHAFGQGDVVNYVVKGRVYVGLVDEDPGKSHHPKRDGMTLVSESRDLTVRRIETRFLLILRPELEECLLHAMKLVKVRSALGSNAAALRRRLGVQGRHHEAFRQELRQLYDASVRLRKETVITELERVVRQALG